jgi:thymidylate synthase (FAD)
MEVTLEQFTDPATIGKYAGICYGREGNNEKRLKHIIDVGHLSCLRFGMAVFKVSGISRVCLAQLTRSKFLDYLVRSSRYCDESSATFIRPKEFDKLPDVVQDTLYEFEEEARHLYEVLKTFGIKKQDARYFLPQAQSTELYVAGNYQAWRDFIALRNTKHAQHEVRAVAAEIERLLQEVAPIIFGGTDGSSAS